MNSRRRARPIVGGGAGTGLSAKCEEAGGIDLIVIYNSGRYRMAGRGSLAGLLAYGNANEIVVEMAREVLPVVRRTPVLAGVNGTDPFCLFDPFLDELKRLGFAGVQNFPTVGLIDGLFRANLEETGMSYDLEVEMIAQARAKDMLTTPYVFCEDEARKMAEAGADIIVCHLGLDDRGRHRREDWPQARRVPGAGRRLGGRRAFGEARRADPRPRRPRRRTRGRRVRAALHPQLPRFLRRVLDGAAADGESDGRTDAALQGDRRRVAEHLRSPKWARKLWEPLFSG